MGKNCYINKFISASNPLQKTSEILFLGKNLVLSIHIMDSFSDNHSFLYYVVRATAISPYLWMCFYTLILSNNTPILQVTSKFRTSPHAFKSFCLCCSQSEKPPAQSLNSVELLFEYFQTCSCLLLPFGLIIHHISVLIEHLVCDCITMPISLYCNRWWTLIVCSQHLENVCRICFITLEEI